jgi:hypothetical protein
MTLDELMGRYYRIVAACPPEVREDIDTLVLGAFELGKGMRVDQRRRGTLSEEDRERIFVAYQAALAGRERVEKGVVRDLMKEFGVAAQTVIAIGRGYPHSARNKPPALRLVPGTVR